jgi:hypothetical protein
MDIFNAWNLVENNFLKDLKMINNPVLRKLGLLPLLVKILNPATQGVAIERANTLTYKTKDYMLSTAQKYHPGFFGDQQHIWQATMPGQINIFSTHPGSPMFDDAARNFSPSYWVGNGINPHAVQHDSTLLLIYDLTPRKGFLEKTRQKFIHFYFPIDKFEEVIQKDKLIFGRKNDSYIAIVSSSSYSIKNNNEIIYDGKKHGFVVTLGSKDEHKNFIDFMATIQNASFVFIKNKLEYSSLHSYELEYKKDFLFDGKIISTDYPRFDTPFVSSKRNPDEVIIENENEKYILNFSKMSRISTISKE